jgi:UDP-glucose 4-epimerase
MHHGSRRLDLRPSQRRNHKRDNVLANKRLLVTGGAGFIGSHMSEYFLERGWAAEIIDDLSTGKRANVPSQATLHTLDIRSADAARVVREGRHDVIIHLAAQMDVRKSVADPVHDAGINIVGTLNLLEALRASPNGKNCRFVFSSTGGVLYGDMTTPPNQETFPKNPDSPYAISKLSVEFYLAYYARIHGMDTVALRYGNVYGPRQDPHGEAGVVAIFCGRIIEGRPLTIFGDGKQTRDYVYVKDVAAATYLAATGTLPKPEKLDVRGFNVGTGVGTSVNDIARTLLGASGRTVPIEYAPARTGEQQHSFLDVGKARDQLGWAPAMTLRDGLRESFEWFAARQRPATAGA